MNLAATSFIMISLVQVGLSAGFALRAPSPRMAAPPSISFEDSLSLAPSFCEALEKGDAPAGLPDFISTSAGARGFFVHWLTNDEYLVADDPTPPSLLADSLASANPEVIEVMLMNVVMSSGTAVAHNRAGNQEQADSSQRTCNRATVLVNALWERAATLRESCDALKRAVSAELGEDVLVLDAGNDEERVDEWCAFLGKGQYDAEQLANIKAALAVCGGEAQQQEGEAD